MVAWIVPMNARYDCYRHRFLDPERRPMRAEIAAPIVGLTRRAALRRAVARLRAARSVLITTHLTPDPDALGCALALASALDRVNIPAMICVGGAIPESFRYLDPTNRVRILGPHEEPPETDVVAVLDISSGWDRVGAFGETLAARQAAKQTTVICLDHHPHTGMEVGIPVLDPHATATAVLVYHLILQLTHDLTPEEASWLYLGIVTDTASFRFPNTNAEAHRVVADLAERGADERRLYAEMYEHVSVARVRLLGEALLGVELACDGKLAYVTVTKEQFARYGLSVEDAPGFADYAAAVEGAEVGAAFLEYPDDRTRVILRASAALSVEPLAEALGGGGHDFAAAAVVAGTAGDALAQLVNSSCGYLTPDGATVPPAAD
jgi:phosphoesterase RecJ-like protein